MNNKCFCYTWLVGQIQNGDMFALYGGFPGSSVVKNLPAMQELQGTWVRSLGRKDLLEEDMAAHSSVLAWRTPWTEKPGGLQSIGSQRVRYY